MFIRYCNQVLYQSCPFFKPNVSGTMPFVGSFYVVAYGRTWVMGFWWIPKLLRCARLLAPGLDYSYVYCGLTLGFMAHSKTGDDHLRPIRIGFTAKSTRKRVSCNPLRERMPGCHFCSPLGDNRSLFHCGTLKKMKDQDRCTCSKLLAFAQLDWWQ